MRVTLVALVLLALAPARGRADVVPPGWRPPPPAPTEETHVALFRASVSEWMDPAERALLDARVHDRCVPGFVGTGRGGTRFGTPRACPPIDAVREVAIDRAVRFFAAEILDVRGRPIDAAALRDAPPMRDAAARALASSHLVGDELEPARMLLARGMGSSLEQIAAALGRLVHAAVRAGVDRGRMTRTAIEMLAELAHPHATIRTWAEPEGEDESARAIARAWGSCLQSEADARWRPVSVRVAIQQGRAGAVVVSTGPPAVRACVEHAARRSLGRARATTGVRLVRVLAGPSGVLWNVPVELGDR